MGGGGGVGAGVGGCVQVIFPAHIAKVIVWTLQAHVTRASEILFSTSIALDSNVILRRAPFPLASFFGVFGDIRLRSLSWTVG